MITVARACRHRLNVFLTSFNAEDFQSTEERQITLWLASDRSESGTHTHDGGGSGPTRLQLVVAVGQAAGAVAGGKTQAQGADCHGDDEAEGRLKVLWGPGGVGKSTLALKSVMERGERQRVTAAGVQAVGFDGAGLRGAARRDAGQERRAGAIVRGGTWAGPRAAAVSGVE
jgi:hypothetical protein